MAITYPTTLDTTSAFPVDITDDTDSKSGTPRTGLKGYLAQNIDDLNAAVVAIETEIGTLPKGPYANVVTRLDTLAAKLSCVAASTVNVTISPGGASFVLDGVTTVNGDKVLLKDQTLPAQNGVYIVSGVGTSVVLTRSTEADSSAELTSMLVLVAGGTVNSDTTWLQVTNPPLTVGTTALRWTRTDPNYAKPARNPWGPGATPPLITNIDRDAAVDSVAQTAITALMSFHGGIVLKAGTVYTNINSFCTAVGSGAVTLNHYSLVRQSDRASLRSTANSTALPGLGVYTRALSSTLTVDVDTPCWVQWSTQVATTSPAFAGVKALTDTLVRPFALTTPIMFGNSTTTPTSTPPADAAVLGAPTTATSGLLYFWLS